MDARLTTRRLLLAAAALLLAGAASAGAAQIVVTTTIQAAVDSANPGDSIYVPPGVYHESVDVTKPNITIRGTRAAILDGAGSMDDGIHVASPMPGARLDGFYLDGLTIRNYEENGVFLDKIDNFTIANGSYDDNEEYGIYPSHSTNGLVEHNRASGAEDAGIYIGQSDSVVIRNNQSTNNLVGIEIENSTHVAAADNLARDNSAGIAVILLPNLNVTVTEDISVTGNTSISNNRPNDNTDPDEIFSVLPGGLGILVVGGDRVELRENRVTANGSAWIAVVSVPPVLADQDPSIDPLPDQVLVADNTVLHNGAHPDPRIAPFPPSDLLWDTTGSGNHWVNNQFRTSYPAPLP
jgi:parallel beta-helix repeat protein